MRETVVCQSVEKALFVGVTRSMNALSTASMVPWIEALKSDFKVSSTRSPTNTSLCLIIAMVDMQMDA